MAPGTHADLAEGAASPDAWLFFLSPLQEKQPQAPYPHEARAFTPVPPTHISLLMLTRGLRAIPFPICLILFRYGILLPDLFCDVSCRRPQTRQSAVQIRCAPIWYDGSGAYARHASVRFLIIPTRPRPARPFTVTKYIIFSQKGGESDRTSSRSDVLEISASVYVGNFRIRMLRLSFSYLRLFFRFTSAILLCVDPGRARITQALEIRCLSYDSGYRR